jgi:nitrile hydratase
LNRALRALGKWSLDTERYELELMNPAEYLRMSYYERWAVRLLKQVVQFGLVTRQELETGHANPDSPKAKPALTAEMSSRFLSRGMASSHDPKIRPRFKVGQRVRALNRNPVNHTRLPRYARGKTGTIDRDHGVYIFPDTNAHFRGEKRQHVYSVRFAALELWGKDASARDFIYIDMWDDYLERI